MAKKKLTIREKALREIKRLDPQVTAPETLESSIFLLVAAQVGTRLREIHRASGLTLRTCRTYSKRAKKNKIFLHGGRIACEWFGRYGGIAFWCDSLALDGLLKKSQPVVDHR